MELDLTNKAFKNNHHKRSKQQKTRPPPSENLNAENRVQAQPIKSRQKITDLEKFVSQSQNRPLPKYASLSSVQRKVVIEWILQGGKELGLQDCTTHLACRIFDRAMSAIDSEQLSRVQLMGIASVFVAAKYQQINPPNIRQILRHSNCDSSSIDVIEGQSQLLSLLQFRISRCPLLTLVHAFSPGLPPLQVQKVTTYLQLAITSWATSRYRPSTIAQAALFLSRGGQAKDEDEEVRQCAKQILHQFIYQERKNDI